MSDRRDFLKAFLGLALSGGTFTLLKACAAGLSYYKATDLNGRIRIPKADATVLSETNGIMIVTSPGANGPVILRNMGGRIVAVSAVCTHRGCEVRPLPDSLQCPCHGSEYDEFGEVIAGPARSPLQRFEVLEKQDLIEIIL